MGTYEEYDVTMTWLDMQELLDVLPQREVPQSFGPLELVEYKPHPLVDSGLRWPTFFERYNQLDGHYEMVPMLLS